MIWMEKTNKLEILYQCQAVKQQKHSLGKSEVENGNRLDGQKEDTSFSYQVVEPERYSK